MIFVIVGRSVSLSLSFSRSLFFYFFLQTILSFLTRICKKTHRRLKVVKFSLTLQESVFRLIKGRVVLWTNGFREENSISDRFLRYRCTRVVYYLSDGRAAGIILSFFLSFFRRLRTQDRNNRVPRFPLLIKNHARCCVFVRHARVFVKKICFFFLLASYLRSSIHAERLAKGKKDTIDQPFGRRQRSRARIHSQPILHASNVMCIMSQE